MWIQAIDDSNFYNHWGELYSNEIIMKNNNKRSFQAI